MAKFLKKWLESQTFADLAKAHGLKDGEKEESRGDTALVKNKPARLAERQYSLLHDTKVVDQAFERLKQSFYDEALANRAPGRPPAYRVEAGRIGDGHPYFFIAPWNESGFLFERSPTGWVISRANKIEAHQTFLRGSEAWDIVNLYRPDGSPGLLRLSSKRLGDELLSFPVYEEELRRILPIAEERA